MPELETFNANRVKSMLKNKKEWAFSLLAVTSYLLSLSGMTYALPSPQAPSRATPATVANAAKAGTPVSFNLKTGKTQVGESVRRRTSSTSTRVSQPSSFSRTNAKPLVQEQLGGRGVKPNTLVAPNYIHVSDTASYPWSTQTKLYVTYSNGNSKGCSGTLIAAKYVLTAGHCVYSKSDGGWAKTIEAIPGGTNKPFGSAYATQVRSYTGWASYQDPNYDIALITLDREIGKKAGWLGYAYFPSIKGVTGYVAGYPDGYGFNGLNLYYHYGSVVSSSSRRVSYQIDTSGGQQGAGVYQFSGGQRYVFAVHTDAGYHDISKNSAGTRIDSEKFDDLEAWIASGQ
ncbi:MAG TPA: trypsin-like serine protease [Coleofasciculaceae cyanobacterium]